MPTEQNNTAGTAETPKGYDEFSSVFDSLTIAQPPADTPPEGDKSPAGATGAAPAAKSPADTSSGAAAGEPANAATADKPAASAGTDSTSEGKPPEGGENADGTSTTQAAEGQGEKPAAAAPAEKDWKAEAERLAAELAAAKAAPPASTQQGDKGAQPAGDTQEPAQPKPVYSADEQKVLDDYRKEWPDVAKGEALARKAEYWALVEYVFQQVAAAYGPLLERAVSGADTLAEDLAVREIKSVHADYSNRMVDDLTAWANTLTGMQKRVALATIEDGEPADVIDLIAEYKRVKGIAQPAGATQQTPAAAAGQAAAGATTTKSNVTELSAAAKKAASALGVVDSKRSAAAPGQADPSDFESAWAEAVAEAK